ncbi:MAG: hypothetical protein Pg6C_04100 [Treponemataceae bacterium]|nr:MAG: hypothetical protein Pg6C_04100 [Treponemataceae bacterium]
MAKEMTLFDVPIKENRRVQGGVATSDVVMSAHIAGNSEIFPQILELHVLPGSKSLMLPMEQEYFGKV